MAMRFPENYLTTLHTRAPARVIAAELVALTDIVGAPTADTAAQRKLLAIESHLGAAQKHFLKRRFAAAIDDYKTAHALIYCLLNKRLPPAVGKFPGIRLPLERRLFKPLLDAAGEILEALPPPPVDPDFGPVFGTRVDTVASATVPYESLGLRRVDELPEPAVRFTHLAAAYRTGELVEPNDPVTMLAAGAALVLLGAGASFFPARHAAHTDPMTSLRQE
ncbi:acidobacterial duplicated orphan permease [Luteitalea pratensis]|uniref:Acidobacterial duplicated orphan permease n=1 Tax=Luteitalea pratensis TaxID=1855912 RepID=A0A143PL92_LUTPR|nr:hypothetical protein [Luteitalea pratensis]AMY08564.1 acidobacterial duplicated orphan permease [Luteitalea pratensis]